MIDNESIVLIVFAERKKTRLFQQERQSKMNEKNIVTFKLDIQKKTKLSKKTKKYLKGLSEDNALQAASNDVDSQPLTKEELAQFKSV